jgi:hypothetical protein
MYDRISAFAIDDVTSIVPQDGAVPLVVKYLPSFPLCDGSTKATAAATSESVAISVAAEKRLDKLLALLIIPPIILDYRL